jgi:hypoxanthine-DNA glycosylase
MSKYNFTQIDFDEIKSLLKKRLIASTDEQKKIRAKIRKFGFMISYHHNGFSDKDFQNLFETGVISITNKTTSNNTIISTTPKKLIEKQIVVKNKKSLPALVDSKTVCLVLGTMPGEKSLTKQEYYTNPSNQFWKIISALFNDGKTFSNYEEKIKILKSNNIGLWDVLEFCEREGSLDSAIKNESINNFSALFKAFPNIKKIIFNGEKGYKYFKPLVSRFNNNEFIVLPSTSSANTRMNFHKKLTYWKDTLIN